MMADEMELLAEHPGGDYVRRVSVRGRKGYVRMTTAEIATMDAWRASLPAKQERRRAEEMQRRRDAMITLKDELESIPAEETRAAAPRR